MPPQASRNAKPGQSTIRRNLEGSGSAKTPTSTLAPPRHSSESPSLYLPDTSPGTGITSIYLGNISPSTTTNHNAARHDADDQHLTQPPPSNFDPNSPYWAISPSAPRRDSPVISTTPEAKEIHSQLSVKGVNSGSDGSSNSDPRQVTDDEYRPPESEENSEAESAMIRAIKGLGKRAADTKPPRTTTSSKAKGKQVAKPKATPVVTRGKGRQGNVKASITTQRTTETYSSKRVSQKKQETSSTKPGSGKKDISNSQGCATPPEKKSKPTNARRPKKSFFDKDLSETQSKTKNPKIDQDFIAPNKHSTESGKWKKDDPNQNVIQNKRVSSTRLRLETKHGETDDGKVAAVSKGKRPAKESQSAQTNKRAKFSSLPIEIPSDPILSSFDAESEGASPKPGPSTQTKASTGKRSNTPETKTQRRSDGKQKEVFEDTSEPVDVPGGDELHQDTFESISIERAASDEITTPASPRDYPSPQSSHHHMEDSGDVVGNSLLTLELHDTPADKPINGPPSTEPATINASEVNGRVLERHNGPRLSQSPKPLEFSHRMARITEKSPVRFFSTTIDPFVDAIGRPTKLGPEAEKRIATSDPRDTTESGSVMHPMSLEFIRRLAEKPGHEADTSAAPASTGEPESVVQTPMKAQKPGEDRAAGRRNAVFQSVLDVTEAALQRLRSEEVPLHTIVENYRRNARKLISKVSDHQTNELRQAAAAFDRKSVELKGLFRRGARHVELIEKRAISNDNRDWQEWQGMKKELDQSVERIREAIHSI